MRARGHACAMRSGARASELLYASIRRETATSSLPRRVHLQDAGPFVPKLSFGRISKCAVPGVSTAVRCTFRSSEPGKAGLVTRASFWQIPIIAPH